MCVCVCVCVCVYICGGDEAKGKGKLVDQKENVATIDIHVV